MNVSLPAPSSADVVAAAAVDEVVAVAADQRVVAWLPMIVSLPAPPSIVSLMTPAGRVGGVDGVVAAEPLDDERVVGALGAGDVDLRRQARRP